VNTETYLRQTLEEWSEDARVPTGLADRALRRRTGRRVAKVALAVGAAALLAGTGAVAVGTRSGPPPVARPVDTSLHTDSEHAPPQRFVAAGQVAVSAYYVAQGDPRKVTRTWYLYDPTSGGYRKVPWAWVDVAPGLRQAAVLDGPLPTTRVGILDMKTQRVTHWIPLKAAAGGLSWSPDGRQLLVTTYARDPDKMGSTPFSGARTGFIVMDVKSGKAHFHSLLFDRENPNTRQDFGWSRSGKLIWAQRMNTPFKLFYDLNGKPQAAPPHEADRQEEAGISPNGRLIALPGPPPGPNTVVNDLQTGHQAGVQPMQQLRAWADDTHLIAQGCLPNACGGKGEFYNRLVLVDVSGKTVIPLTGYKKGGWEPIFTHR
jgi:hypothetical protein